jgi:hypothetical protein
MIARCSLPKPLLIANLPARGSFDDLGGDPAGGAFVSDLFIRSPMTSWVFLRQLSRELVAQCLRQVEFGKLPTPL